jgi:CubicO group peptidase (beta-lactamase class C family)
VGELRRPANVHVFAARRQPRRWPFRAPRRIIPAMPTYPRSYPIALLCVAALSTSAPAQQVPADLDPKIDALFARFDRNTPGCGVGLSKDGKVLHVKGYGAANLEFGVPNTDSTVFESGSVAKQFTAAALVLLEQDGKLKLDDDIRKYLPEVPSFGGQKITIRHLLTHTSGLRDQWGLLGIEGRGPGSQVHSALTTLDLIKHQRMLNFPPGSAYLYSNSGYALAGLIVERVSGKTLDAFSQERLFKPLGMLHTQWRDDHTEVVRNRATAYRGGGANGFHTDMPFTDMIGNGGLLSTMSDLMKWNENLDNPKVGGRAFTQALETRMRLNNGRTITYALGLQVDDYRGVREVAHGGSTAGYRTHLARYPDQRVSVAVWCNNASAGPAPLLHQVADLVLSFPPATVAQASVERVDVPASEISRWAGMYRDASTDQVVSLVASASGLSPAGGRGGRGNAPPVWTPRGGARFASPQGEAQFAGAAGRRTMTLVRPDGDTTKYEEVRPAPASIKTADYVGTYASDELEVKLVIGVRDGKLVLRRRPADEFELRPVYADDFQPVGGGGLGTLRFSRNANGKITGFAVFAGRVLDVRFKKIDN